jgi:hypothetical protein
VKTIYKDDSTSFGDDWGADSTFSSPLNIPTHQNDGDNERDSLRSDKKSCAEETSNIAKDLGKHIFSLMELVPSMENTLAQIKGKVSTPTRVDFTVSEPAWPYASHVRDKFGKADPRLIQRLGQANWERHIKITERLDEDADAYSKATQGINEAKSIFTPSSLFHDSGLGSSSHTIHSNNVALRPSSSASHPRYSHRLRVPLTPSEVQKGIPFACSICGHVLHKIKSRNDWKYDDPESSINISGELIDNRVHVFADLQPYMCTFPSRRDEFVTFPTRKSWADHEFSYHRVDKHWLCPRCPDELPSTDRWKEHLAHEHGITYSGLTYQAAIETAEDTVPRPHETQQCPLCFEVPGHSQKSFINHVGEHLEEIALAALPRKPVSRSETDSMSSTHSANAEPHLLKGGENELVSSLMSSKPVEESESRTFLPHDKRPEKCPLETCTKSFDRKFDRNRHALTHFKGTLMCRFCPQFGSAGLHQFARVDMFKKHLIERHGAGVGRSLSQQRGYRCMATVASVLCAVCQHTFSNAQTMYRHLDECILRLIERRYDRQSTRGNVSYSQSSAKVTRHDTSEISGTGALSNTIHVEPSSPKSFIGSHLWSHDIPLGVDGLYHCPWETSIHCSHAPVRLRYDLQYVIYVNARFIPVPLLTDS